METFEERLDAMQSEIKEILFDLIEKKGVKSKHYSDNCLKIKSDDLMFNLEGGRYLTEIKHSSSHRGEIELVDNSGYSYDDSALDTENYIQVADHLIKESQYTEYSATDIIYDLDEDEDGADLPKTIAIKVPNEIILSSDIEDYISDKISDETGFCHKGFSISPEIE